MVSLTTGRAALVTGATSGIGLAVARALARRGVRVGLLARRVEELKTLAAQIRANGGVADEVPADVTDAVALQAAVDGFLAKAGRLDLVVASAGLGEATPAWAFDNALSQRMIDLNIGGVINTVWACAPALVESKGHLVALSSLAGLRGLPGNATYCATKAAVAALTEGFRADFARKSVTTTCVHPGWVKTPMTEGNQADMSMVLDPDTLAEDIVDAAEKRNSALMRPAALALSTRLGNLAPNAAFDLYMHGRTWPFAATAPRPKPNPRRPGAGPYVAVVTGASTGIGRALAEQLGRKRAVVVMLARREDVLAEAARSVEALGGTARAHTVDVRDDAAVARIIQSTRAEFGRIDLFVANAGTGGASVAHKLDLAVTQPMVDLNVKAFTANIGAVLPVFLEQGYGHVAGVGSLAAFRGMAKAGVYCASKAYVRSFMESLRADLKPYGITSTCVSPGYVKTALNEKSHASLPFLMEPEAAAREIWSAIVKKQAHHAFPAPLVGIIRLGQILPAPLFDRMTGAK